MFQQYLGLVAVFAAVVGLPAIYIYRRIGWNKPWHYTIGGVLIGCVVYLALIGPVDMIFKYSDVISITQDIKTIIEMLVMLCVASVVGSMSYWYISIRKA